MNRVTDSILYIGVNDHDIDLFEGMYTVPHGMAYNSYVILDDKIAVMDTVDARFGSLWLENLQAALDGKSPDYLIVQHMEPDHSANIETFIKTFPQARVVGNAKTFTMMEQFFENLDLPADRRVVVKGGDTLPLGHHTLQFLFTPMVHWPEVMMTYESSEKIFFSADAFGKFGALDVEEDDWACEARRYYFGIVGKYGVQVQSVLKQAASLEIATICPLHGPILKENLGEYLNLYQIWSSYGVESEGVMIAYTSVYGDTKAAALYLADLLEKRGCPKVVCCDLAREDMAEAVEDAFRYGKLVLATTTYNAGIFPFMRNFIESLTERGYQNRTIGLIENGSWAPTAARVMKTMLADAKNINLLEPVVTIRSAMKEPTREALATLADALMK